MPPIATDVAPDHLVACLAALWPESVDRLPTLASERITLQLDSRRVNAGDVFIAVPGVASDGRDFIPSALKAGACLVLAHGDGAASVDSDPDARVVVLDGLCERLGEFGRLLFEVPEDLQVVGVTGTNGKSSVTHYIAELSQALDVDAAVVGTLGLGRPGSLAEAGLTTPGPLALQAALGRLAGNGVTRVAMEVSSHALDQGRLEGCRITAAVFTNLSRDHLDYHGSMASYAAAKAKLFRRPELTLAVVNANDSLARLMLAGLAPGVRVLASGEDEAVTLRVLDWFPHAEGQRALIATPDGERELSLGLMGRFNLDNVLLAIATLHGLGHPLEALFEAATHLQPVPGRMQVVTLPGAPTVVVDYAHTPDALDNALTALRDHLPGSGRLWCLFGCGGDRDAGKRALMAAAAERHADRLVITDDNPRSETPSAIRTQVCEGLSADARVRAWNIEGRGAAIARLLGDAGVDDVVLIAGKGHEDYQETNGVREPFSDVEQAERALSTRVAGEARP
ncbi:UDP-N-acetylmuramoyl-L-alanyl-D-glutamate--2,6-diaminopimelate ligase [Halomonas urumqiensis]|uniref:UDP-N-acetylmuramoyl-L-alanyl-D-glutamate--2,6-diaminopimelate ligase n=1 Tax=Halomonas urumqiensis TaxID=1684789 RepID=A0A2N7UGA2_9GAMM|nr:UDP-N-acetylmuramoyl-L-alanyl-D-glutamate--2,6-diaminopimelate ligase [Halomonas urumqiensis]PMR79497.1 UDP-N-acetylmuramoyl-L-alanyl-D-glutamate--2,6-diaminopimelate ligase [Halomonas urumqiensis]PTB01380.1 UDP-N-acetylmuramoyl-L-alanyl-D-glutamate--2,6-diaminopimelate ligase [Halomonas urumqiensis]GHE22535.1 UDP-N-acetylmuramoyl-L-alanyl-D-glutamate--2,6-diaminopimelate ligase [Halomonas urumqiensis]